MTYDPIIQALVDAGAEFVIIGGWSAVLLGSSYMTDDLGVCFSRRSANLKRIAKALAPFHPRLRGLPMGLPFVWDDVTLRNGTVFTLTTDLGAVDLLAEVSGVGDYAQAKAGSVLKNAFGRDVWVLDLEALIAAKRAAGREKDLRMLPELEAMLEARKGE